jgi:hypothetical protein
MTAQDAGKVANPEQHIDRPIARICAYLIDAPVGERAPREGRITEIALSGPMIQLANTTKQRLFA